MAVDFHARQIIALCAVASSWLSVAVCVGLAVAYWSDVLVYLAGVYALAGAVVSVAAMPRWAMPAEPAGPPDTPRVLLLPHLSNPAAPTRAELAGATDLTPFLSEVRLVEGAALEDGAAT